MIDTKSAHWLARNAETKDACSKLMPLQTPLNCEGAEKGRVIGKVEWWMTVKLTFSEPAGTDQKVVDTKNQYLADLRRRGPSRGAILGKFYLMDALADPMILGYPEMCSLGCWMEPPGDDGRRWVQFTSMGIRVPITEDKKRGLEAVKVDGVTEVEGPALHAVKVVVSAKEYNDRVA